jgi:tRNA 5-methylaminomethyl-2-thiouridine biosynthesis bifunctional protein
VPDLQAPRTRAIDQVRFVPRVPGLFVFTALGSRGITWSALGAETLASAITGAPAPLESSLLDAIDPGRFVARQVRRDAR